MRWGRGTTTARGGRPGAVARGSVSPVSVTVGAVTVGAVLVLGLAGCAPEPIPPVPTTDRPSPTVEPTPEPEPEPAPETVHPQRPAAMDTVDAAGAEAAVEYFLRLYSYGFATGDLAEVRALSHPECIFCASVIDGVEETFDGGYRTVGGLTSTSGTQSRPVDPGDAWMVTTTVNQAPSTTVDADGTVVAEHEGEFVESSVFVFHDGEQWWIRGVDMGGEE